MLCNIPGNFSSLKGFSLIFPKVHLVEVGVCHIKEENVFNLQTLASGVVTLPLGLYPLSDEGLLTLGGGSQPKLKSHPVVSRAV